MKIKVFDKGLIPPQKEAEIFLKLEGDYDGKFVNLLLVSKDGSQILAPYVLSFHANPKTGKLTFTRTGGVNMGVVETEGGHTFIKEA